MTVVLNPATTTADDLPHGEVVLTAGEQMLVRITAGHYLQVGPDTWLAPDLMCAYWAENPDLATGDWSATCVALGTALVTHHIRN